MTVYLDKIIISVHFAFITVAMRLLLHYLLLIYTYDQFSVVQLPVAIDC